jgi:periplasmic divalent cation tolerance protein
MLPELKLVYITAPSKEVAQELGHSLVESRLAACINILPQMTSMYWWEDKLTQSEEAVLIAKTSAHLVDALIAKVEREHPYTVPCVISIPIEKVATSYATWLHSNLTNLP